MKHKKWIILCVAVLLGLLLFSFSAASTAFGATTISMSSTHSTTVTKGADVIPNAAAYIRSYRLGYQNAVTDCKASGVSARAAITQQEKGYTDGYNYARSNDPACTGKSTGTVSQTTISYAQAYRLGYQNAVTDCKAVGFGARAATTRQEQGYTDGYNYARSNDPACASKSTGTVSQTTTSYTQSYRLGYQNAVTDCKATGFAARSAITRQEQGYTDGYNYARSNDPACVSKKSGG